MADFAEIARGLLSLEINTVQKDGMSAQKMPSPANALIEVAQDYHEFLCRKATDFGPLGEELPGWTAHLSATFDWGREPFPPPASPAVKHRQDARNGDFLKRGPSDADMKTFDDIREIAAWLLEMYDRTRALASGSATRLRAEFADDELDLATKAVEKWQAAGVEKLRAEDRAILSRIQRNSDQLKAITLKFSDSRVTRQSTDRLDASELVILRKAWDISTEVVVMQTVIQIDGDVVNRIQPGRETEEHKSLHALHAGAVDISFRYWRWLIETLGRIAGQAVSSLLK